MVSQPHERTLDDHARAGHGKADIARGHWKWSNDLLAQLKAHRWLHPCSELWVAAVLATVLIALTLSGQWITIAPPNYQHLGVEYYNIARAIVDGRGFSDPFGEPSGSTAWMPPFYPMLLAALLWLLQKKSLVAVVVVALQVFAYVTIGITVYRIAKDLHRRVVPLVSVLVFIVWVSAFAFWLLMCTHDIWLISLLVTAQTSAVHTYLRTGRVRYWRWGLIGAASCAISPSASMSWLVLTLLGVLRGRQHWRKAGLTLALVGILATPWAVRNAMTFHRFIPVKSNLFLDAYQANCSDEDGIIDLRTTNRHPHESLDTRFRLTQMGEAKFMDDQQRKFIQCLRDRPASYFARVGNRLLAMTLVYVPFFSESPLGVTVRRLIFGLPFIALIMTLWGPSRRFVRALATIYVSYLLPYGAVTFHIRYFLPLTPVCVLVVFNFFEWLLDRMSPKTERPEVTLHSRETGAQCVREP